MQRLGSPAHRSLSFPRIRIVAAAAALSLTAMSAAGAQTVIRSQAFAQKCGALNSYAMENPAARDGVSRVQLVSAVVKAPTTPTDPPLHCVVTFSFYFDLDKPGDWYGTSTYFLPARWNGRFVHEGGGGASSGWTGIADPTLLGEGTAHAQMNNDSMERGVLWLNQDLNNRAARLFSRDGIHLSTVLGKRLITKFYGKPQTRSYYIGCSTGGNQGLQIALWHPQTFDGISAGAPVFYTQEMAQWPLWQKEVQAGKFTTSATSKLIAEQVLAQCDALDGTADGVIDWPESCHPDLQRIAAAAGLSEQELAFLKDYLADKLISGYDSSKHRVVNLVRPGKSIVNPSVGSASITALFAPDWWAAVQPGYLPADNGNSTLWLPSFLAYDFASQTWNNWLSTYSGTAAGGQYSQDLHELVRTGHKLLVWQTFTDPITNPRHTRDWVEFQTEQRENRGLGEHFRFLQKTTGGHCSANTTVLRQALYDWVEKGSAPDSLQLDTNSARPSCNYPKFPKFSAGSNTWSCVVPPGTKTDRDSWQDHWGIRSAVERAAP